MKLRTGDILYEPLSRNTGEITSIIEHPVGKLVKGYLSILFNIAEIKIFNRSL